MKTDVSSNMLMYLIKVSICLYETMVSFGYKVFPNFETGID
jgi:hypothetical protein